MARDKRCYPRVKFAFDPRARCAAASFALALTAGFAGTAAAEETLAADTYDCVIMPDVVLDVSAGAGGLIDKVHAERGSRVVAGDVLVELESGVEQANLALARSRSEMDSEIRLLEAALNFDQRRKARSEALFERSAISSHEKENVETDEAVARWRLRQAKDKHELAALEVHRAHEVLKLRTIRSEIDGVVIERFKSPGEFVEYEPIMRVAKLDPLAVEVIVPVYRHKDIRVGMQAQVVSDSAPDQPRDAQVTLIDPVADPASATFRVRLELPNPEGDFLAGIKCTSRFQPGEPVQMQADAAGAPVEAFGARGAATAPLAAPTPLPAATAVAVHEPAASAGEPVAAASVASPVARTADFSPSPAQVTATACATLGPILDQADLEDISARLLTRDIDVVIRAGQESVPNGYIVLTPAQDTLNDAHTMAATLRAEGLVDLGVMRRGPYAKRISFGAYLHESAAARRVEALARRGIEADAVMREKQRQVWWLDSQTAVPETVLAQLSAEAGHIPAAPVTCLGQASVDATDGQD